MTDKFLSDWDVLLPLAAFAICWGVHRVLLSARWRNLAVDQPNARSLHQNPVPRTGGLAIMLGSLMALLATADTRGPLLVAVALCALSFLDDRYGLPVRLRLALHLSAAAAAVIWAMPWPGWMVWTVALLGVAWMTNLYNFMDGSDGLAGAMAVTGFTAYAGAAWFAGQYEWALALMVLAASAAAFLFFNWPSARIFMGDSGSIPLGFLAATMGVAGWAWQWWPAWFPVAVFAPFIVDATLTLVRRALRREAIWRAHREHAYQRLILAGWSKKRLLMFALPVMAGSALWALAVLRAVPAQRTWGLAAFLLFYVVLFVTVDVYCRGRQKR